MILKYKSIKRPFLHCLVIAKNPGYAIDYALPKKECLRKICGYSLKDNFLMPTFQKVKDWWKEDLIYPITIALRWASLGHVGKMSDEKTAISSCKANLRVGTGTLFDYGSDIIRTNCRETSQK